MKLARISLVLACLVLAAAVALPATQANHQKRIVMPFGIDERHVPVVAGYEVAPRPLGCDVGEPLETDVIYRQDFEGGAHDLDFGATPIQIHGGFRNLFHVTSFAGEGTDVGHSGPNRLYFGNDATGVFAWGLTRLGGTASMPSFVVPTTPTFVSWKEKFEVEAFFGYDHMWMELVDVGTGEIYILCSSDADSRPDKSSNSNTIASCSPYRVGVCPSGVQGNAGTGFGIDLGVVPIRAIDPTAPHWHARYVQIPPVFIGREVVLRFSFDSADGVSNRFLGWMIDDIMVSGAVIPQPYVHVPVPPVPAA